MQSHLIRSIAAGLLCVASCFSAMAQDLIASQAPIDRKLKAVDSASIQRLIQADEIESGISLYDTWNTTRAHCYSNAAVPDSFRIDLRGFAMPTPSRNITSRFGYRATFRRMHKGLDIKVYTGDTIVSAFDGKVRVVKYDAGGYGNYIVVRHNNGLETIYGHLSKQLVSVDQQVKAGEPIGLGGNTGRSFGSHLHFETRLLGEAIDPSLLFDFPNQDVTSDFYVFHKDRDNDGVVMASDAGNEKRSARQSATMASHFYQVKSGESLHSIARKLGVSVDHICQANNLTPKSKIRNKQILKY